MTFYCHWNVSKDIVIVIVCCLYNIKWISPALYFWIHKPICSKAHCLVFITLSSKEQINKQSCVYHQGSTERNALAWLVGVVWMNSATETCFLAGAWFRFSSLRLWHQTSTEAEKLFITTGWELSASGFKSLVLRNVHDKLCSNWTCSALSVHAFYSGQ